MQHLLDRILVETWLRTRDEGTFRLLYRRHVKAMWRLGLRLANGDETIAEEVVQDAWLRAVERLPGFRWEAALRTWLCGFVVNRWREQVRKEGFERQHFTAIENGLDAVAKPVDFAAKMDMATLFGNLPEPLREVLTLHDLQGFKHREIAAMIGIAEGTSKSRLSEARRLFRSFFEKVAVWLLL